MASELHVVVADASRIDPDWRCGVTDMLQHLERCWSRFLPDSDVSQLNSARGRPVHVDQSTLTLLATMAEAWQATQHRFDPTTLPALIEIGYASSIDDPCRVTVLPNDQVYVGGFDRTANDGTTATLDEVVIDVDMGTIELPANLAIDAGGVGKGLAADLAAAWLVERGASGALVSIGGDISTAGKAPAGGWIIVIEHPDSGGIGTLAIDGGGVATSSTRSRQWRQGDVERHHLIDPWTGGQSTTDLWSATVIARSGWLAEAHATAALLASSEHVIDYLDHNDLTGVAVTADGRVLCTDDLAGLRLTPAGAPR